MGILLLLSALLGIAPAIAQPTPPPAHEELLDRLVGDWVMTGTIAGASVVHDVTAEWVLGRRYLRIHDLSTEMAADGTPAYEAWIHIAWDDQNREYAVMWLDNTGTTNFAEEGVGHGTPDGDRIPFVWSFADGSGIRNTFQFQRDRDVWTWTIVNVDTSGRSRPFANVTLQRN